MAWHWLKLAWVGVLLALLVFARRAAAEEPARLVYARGVGADSCPDEVDLRLAVVARLGHDPFSPGASRAIVAHIDVRADEMLGSVELVDATGVSRGRRELSSPRTHCAELSRAMALSISLMLDPEMPESSSRKSLRDAERRTAPEPVALPPIAPSSRVEPGDEAAVPRPTTSRRLRPFAGLQLGGVSGAVPGLALGGSASLGVAWRFWSLGLEGTLLRSLSRDLTPDGSLHGTLVAPGLAACGVLARLEVCAVGQLGLQRLGASDVPDARARGALYGALGPRMAWTFPVAERLALVAELQGLFNLTRNAATLAGRPVWRTPVLSEALLVGARSDFL